MYKTPRHAAQQCKFTFPMTVIYGEIIKKIYIKKDQYNVHTYGISFCVFLIYL